MDEDQTRRLAVTASGIICVVGTLVGVGVIGTRVEESSGGRLAADATLIAPAGPAFSIWSVVYLGLLAYVIWQWLPAQARAERMRRTGWLAAASMVLNAAWLLVTQAGWLVVSVLVIVALLVTLGLLVARLHDDPAASTAERVVVDGTFGLYLGWVCVATCANIAATLVGLGVPATGTGPVIATVVVIAVVVAVAAGLARRLTGQIGVAIGIAWGLAWVAVGRSADEPRSLAVAVVAGVAAVVVAGVFARAQLASGGRPGEGPGEGRGKRPGSHAAAEA